MKRAAKPRSHSAAGLFQEPERPAGVFTAYVDGAARGNPGPASYAVIVCAPDGRQARFQIEQVSRPRHQQRRRVPCADRRARLRAIAAHYAAGGAQRFRAAGAPDAGPLQSKKRLMLRPLHERAQKMARGPRSLRYRAHPARAKQRSRRAGQSRARRDVNCGWPLPGPRRRHGRRYGWPKHGDGFRDFPSCRVAVCSSAGWAADSRAILCRGVASAGSARSRRRRHRRNYLQEACAALTCSAPGDFKT